jgi:hypothetical protein
MIEVVVLLFGNRSGKGSPMVPAATIGSPSGIKGADDNYVLTPSRDLLRLVNKLTN